MESDTDYKEKYMSNINKYFPKIKNIIGISSGKGGAGKSILTNKIATFLTNNNLKIGVLDADILNPTQHILFRIENEYMVADTDQHGHTTAFPVEKNNIKIASMGFVLNRDNAIALRGHRLSQIFIAFIKQLE